MIEATIWRTILSDDMRIWMSVDGRLMTPDLLISNRRPVEIHTDKERARTLTARDMKKRRLLSLSVGR